jgi:hypothetical protein
MGLKVYEVYSWLRSETWQYTGLTRARRSWRVQYSGFHDGVPKTITPGHKMVGDDACLRYLYSLHPRVQSSTQPTIQEQGRQYISQKAIRRSLVCGENTGKTG